MLGHAQENPIQSAFVALLLLILGFIFVPLIKTPNRKFILGLFISGFVLRTICVYLVYYYLISVGGDGFAFTDDRSYDAAGKEIAKALNAGRNGYDLYSQEQNPAYFYFNGWLYSILGSDTLSARMVNSFLSSITAILVFEIGRLIFNYRVARIAGILAALMPSIVYLSVLQFKDTALIFVMIYTVYLLVTKQNKPITFISLLSIMGSLSVMWFLRKDYALPYFGIIILWLTLRYTGLENIISNLKKRSLYIFAGPAILILGSCILVGLANTEAGLVFIDRYDKITGNNKEFVENANSAQIGFSRHLRINSVTDMYKLPIAVPFTIILPLPAFDWLTKADRAGAAIYSITNIFFILSLPYVVLGFILTRKISFTNSIMVRLFPIVVLIGISVVFMGVLRYKEQLMSYFCLWAAVAICERKKYKTTLALTYVIGALSIFTAAGLAIMLR